MVLEWENFVLVAMGRGDFVCMITVLQSTPTVATVVVVEVEKIYSMRIKARKVAENLANDEYSSN